jgi:hypothetical protein
MAKKYLTDLSEHRETQKSNEAASRERERAFARRFNEWADTTLQEAAGIIKAELEEMGLGLRYERDYLPPSSADARESLTETLDVLQHPERKGGDRQGYIPFIARLSAEGVYESEAVAFGGMARGVHHTAGETAPLDRLDVDATAEHLARVIKELVRA